MPRAFGEDPRELPPPYSPYCTYAPFLTAKCATFRQLLKLKLASAKSERAQGGALDIMSRERGRDDRDGGRGRDDRKVSLLVRNLPLDARHVS